MAEFDSPSDLVDAARRTYEAGYRKMDAYSPFPIEGAGGGHRLPSRPCAADRADRRHYRRAHRLPDAVLDVAVVSYPLNIGGKPYHSWPAFIIITFEMTILFAGIAAVFGMLALNGLPMPYHPVFNVPRFVFARKDRFFLIVFASDPAVSTPGTRKFLEA